MNIYEYLYTQVARSITASRDENLLVTEITVKFNDRQISGKILFYESSLR